MNSSQVSTDSLCITTPASSAISARPLDAEMTGIRPATSAKQEEEGEIGREFAEDSTQISRTSSATLMSVPKPARKASRIQPVSTNNQNSNESNRNDTSNRNRESNVSNPSMKSQAISVVASSSQSAKPHATSHWNGAPQQPNSRKVLHGYSVLHAEDSTYSETDSESNTSFQHGVMADVLSRLPFASAASEEPANSIPSPNSALWTQINDKVSQPLRKRSEPLRGYELPRLETANFTQDLSYSVEKTIPSSVPRFQRPVRDETTTNRSFTERETKRLVRTPSRNS